LNYITFYKCWIISHFTNVELYYILQLLNYITFYQLELYHILRILNYATFYNYWIISHFTNLELYNILQLLNYITFYKYNFFPITHFCPISISVRQKMFLKNQLYLEVIKFSLGIIQARKFTYSGYQNDIIQLHNLLLYYTCKTFLRVSRSPRLKG